MSAVRGGRVPLSGLPSQQKTDAVTIDSDLEMGHLARKVFGAVGRNPIEDAVLEVVDHRFHPRMLTGHCDEITGSVPNRP